MNIKIVRIDTTLPMPEYKTHGSVAFDLYAREETNIPAEKTVLIPLNVIIETPPGYVLMLVPRSSLPRRYGLLYPHGIGIIDQDYCGPEDELKLQVYNPTNHTITIPRHERIAQALFVCIKKATFDEVKTINSISRGGFGSTG